MTTDEQRHRIRRTSTFHINVGAVSVNGIHSLRYLLERKDLAKPPHES